ncbi:MAG: hypothetical protein WDZ59_09695 [Pirellulales bacterium]
MKNQTTLWIAFVSIVLAGLSAHAQLVEVNEAFSRDPGWDHFQNRIIGIQMPTARRRSS